MFDDTWNENFANAILGKTNETTSNSNEGTINLSRQIDSPLNYTQMETTENNISEITDTSIILSQQSNSLSSINHPDNPNQSNHQLQTSYETQKDLTENNTTTGISDQLLSSQPIGNSFLSTSISSSSAKNSSIVNRTIAQEYETLAQTYSNDDLSTTETQCNLFSLLKSWGFESLYDYFKGNEFDLESFKYIRLHHLEEIFLSLNIPLAKRIQFEGYLNEWQKYMGTYNPTYYYMKTADKNVLAHDNQKECSTSNNEMAASTSSQSETSVNVTKNENTNKKKIILLCDILKSSLEGGMIKSYYDENKKFNENIRTKLVEIIVRYFLQAGVSLNVEYCNNISDQIVKMFPTEIKIIYFAPRKNKAPLGKLLNKYNNTIRDLRISGLIEKRKTRTKNVDDGNLPDATATDTLVTPEEKSDVIRLQLRFVRDTANWEDTKVLWKQCSNLRKTHIIGTELNNLSEIFVKWPAYKQPKGHQLIDIDFESISSKSIFNVIDKFIECMLCQYEIKIKEINCKTLLKEIQESSNILQDSKHIAVFYLLHGLIVPTGKSIKRNNQGKQVQKFTIKDSQESFVLICPTVAKCEEIILTKKENKIPIQPFLIVIGDIFNPQQFLVYFDDIKYTFESFLHALETCFKIFQVFNLNYPSESVAVWQFLQILIYKIKTKFDKTIPSVSQIISEIDLYSE